MYARKFAPALAVLALAFVAPFQAAAQSGSPWLHIQVVESGDDSDETVHVNVPLSLARVAVQLAPKKVTEKLSAKLEENEVSLDDIRALWTEVKRTGDAEFVTVESESESVRVARAGDSIRVYVEDRGKDEGDEAGEKVEVQIPIAVVDALLSGEGDELNLDAAVERLSEERGQIVQVQDGESRVRVWIDERS